MIGSGGIAAPAFSAAIFSSYPSTGLGNEGITELNLLLLTMGTLVVGSSVGGVNNEGGDGEDEDLVSVLLSLTNSSVAFSDALTPRGIEKVLSLLEEVVPTFLDSRPFNHSPPPTNQNEKKNIHFFGYQTRNFKLDDDHIHTVTSIHS